LLLFTTAQKVKAQLAGGGAYCGSLPHGLLNYGFKLTQCAPPTKKTKDTF